jgi:Pentapeptide repeats (8 copies)
MLDEPPPQRPQRGSPVLAPFAWLNWVLEWVAYRLSGLAIFKVLEYAGKLTILGAAILWIAGAPERENAERRAAWTIVNSQGGGRREALEHLYSHGVNLRGLNGQNGYFGDIDLHGADLRWANLSHANLDGANLQGANLQGANFEFTSLRNIKLRGAKLERSNLLGTDFSEADLTEVNMRGADLVSGQTIFKGATIDHADMRGVSYTDIPLIRNRVVSAIATTRDWKSAMLDEQLRMEIEKALASGR